MSFDHSQLKAEYDACSAQKQVYLDDLKQIVVDSKESLEGNSFYKHASLNLYSDLYAKQTNIFWCGKQATTRICEIGFNAGHSTMLMLLGRDTTPLEFTVFDIGHHTYTRPCLDYMRSKFPHVAFEYIEGDSTATMPKWIRENRHSYESYDVIHVDGGHEEKCIINDMKNADLLVRPGGILIIDDTNYSYINTVVDQYLKSGNYKELDVLKTAGYPHRIIQKCVA